jgi:hypothetical protein
LQPCRALTRGSAALPDAGYESRVRRYRVRSYRYACTNSRSCCRALVAAGWLPFGQWPRGDVFVNNRNALERSVVAAGDPHADMIPDLDYADAWCVAAHHKVADLHWVRPLSGLHRSGS